jgi:hypothetical protein
MLQWFVAMDLSATTGKSYATGLRGETDRQSQQQHNQ